MRDKRKNPYEFKRWYLLHYQSRYYFWSIVILILSLGFLAFSKWNTFLDLGRITAGFVIGVFIGMGGIIIRIIKTLKNYFDDNYVIKYNGDFDIKNIKIPDILEESGYEKYIGGLVKNIFNKDLQIAGSVSSKKINERLWEISNKNNGKFLLKLPANYNIIGYRRKWNLPVLAKKMLFGILKNLNVFKERIIANETKIRLRKDLLLPFQDYKLSIEKTDYISDLLTGQITGAVIYDKYGGIIYNGYDFSYNYNQNGLYLKACTESQTSSQIGASSLILGLTKKNILKSQISGHIAIVNQGSGNLQSGGLLAPSGSGSLDWSDYFEYRDRMIIKGMHRELFEETNKGSWDRLINKIKIKTIIIGFGRMLHRGGKPEFYGLVIMPRDIDQYGIDKTERRYVKGFEWINISHVTAKNVVESLNDYKNKNISKLSHPLFMCIELAIEYLEKNENLFEDAVSEIYKSM